MKSSSNLHLQTTPDQFQPWTPPEFDQAAPPSNPQLKELLDVFRRGANGAEVEVNKPSVLHKGGTGLKLQSWEPGDMDCDVREASKPGWIFFGSSEDPHREESQPHYFEFEVLQEAVPQEQDGTEDEDTSLVLDQARLQAEEIILAAQAEADQVLFQAQEEIDEQKREAFQQGKDQAVAEMAEALAATNNMVEEVRAWHADLLLQGERILVEMLVEIAQKMFGEGVELNQEALQINLNRVLENAHGLGDLKIFLNPRDAKLLDPSWSEYQMLVTGDRVKVVPSGKITPGGCFVKGNMGSVDGRVETQLSAILNVFEEDSELAE